MNMFDKGYTEECICLQGLYSIEWYYKTDFSIVLFYSNKENL